jgi:hypothetical protein
MRVSPVCALLSFSSSLLAALRIALLAAERRKSDDASLHEILEATAKFLANPGEIAVTANPPPGISSSC